MKRYVILLILISILLTGCFTVVPGQPQTDPNGGKTTKPTTEETRSNGWVKEAGKTYYLREDGSRHVGWLDLDGKRYYLDNMGVLQTGWLELNDETYYLQADGSAATGKVIILFKEKLNEEWVHNHGPQRHRFHWACYCL